VAQTASPFQAQSIRPILRWAGGKSLMAERLAETLPSSWENYFEPMAGGAALFFALQPRRAVLADVNSELMNFYRALQTTPRYLIQRLMSLTASRDQYYALRSSRPRGIIQRAIRFAYLNRLAWNGLYRVNRSGDFNVPIGDRLPTVMWSEKELLRASSMLASAELVTGDFRDTVQRAAAGDLVFFDPPYPRGSRDHVGFNRYTSQFFSEKDHRDLACLIGELTRRSVLVVLTIAGTGYLEGLYPRAMRRTLTTSKSLIACNGAGRREVGELILTNF